MHVIVLVLVDSVTGVCVCVCWRSCFLFHKKLFVSSFQFFFLPISYHFRSFADCCVVMFCFTSLLFPGQSEFDWHLVKSVWMCVQALFSLFFLQSYYFFFFLYSGLSLHTHTHTHVTRIVGDLISSWNFRSYSLAVDLFIRTLIQVFSDPSNKNK